MKKFLTLGLVFAGATTLTACSNNAEKEAQAAVEKVLLSMDYRNILLDIDLPEKVVMANKDYEIVWSSSDESHLTKTGAVINPAVGDGNKEVLLTASITVNKKKASKEFKTRVLEGRILTPKQAMEATVEKGSKFIVVGVVSALDKVGKGFFVKNEDSHDNIYIYNNNVAHTFVAGDKVKVAGTKDVYQDVTQVKDVTMKKINSGFNVGETLVKTIAELPVTPTNDEKAAYYGRNIEIKGKVLADNYVYLVETNYTSARLIQLTDDSATKNLLTEYGNKEVTIKGVVKQFNFKAWQIVFHEVKGAATEGFSASDIATYIQTSIDAKANNNVTAGFTLPARLSNVSITYTSQNSAAVVGATSNFVTTITVTRPAIGAADVTGTITATYSINGAAPVTRTFSITVKALTA